MSKVLLVLVVVCLVCQSAIAADDAVALPAGTLIPVEMMEPVGSNTHRRGDRFKMSVSQDVRIGNSVLVPRGSAVVGEVIHAAKSSYGGRPGELILTARRIIVDDRVIVLKSLMMNAVGASRSGAAMTAATAADVAATATAQSRELIASGASGGSSSVVAPVVAAALVTVAIRGKKAVVPVGTVFFAATANTESLALDPVSENSTPRN